MNVSNESIVVSYQKRPTECRCCGRAFDIKEADFGSLKEFEVTVKNFFEWTDWTTEEHFKELAPYYEGQLYEDDLKSIVEQYVYNEISFFACNSEEVLKIEQAEVDKVYELIKAEVLRLIVKTDLASN